MEPTVSVIDIKDEQEDKKKKGNNETEQESQEHPKEETCCCCIALKKGAKIIGFIQILINGTVFLFVTIVDFTFLKNTFDWNNKMAGNDSEYMMYEDEKEGFCGAHSLELESLIMMAIAVKLLIGVFKNKPNLIEQWYHSTAELVLLSLILFVTRASVIFIISNTYNYVLMNFIEPLYHVVMCYFTWVVYKYYISITREHSRDDLSIRS